MFDVKTLIEFPRFHAKSEIHPSFILSGLFSAPNAHIIAGVAELTRESLVLPHKAPPMNPTRNALIVDDSPDVAKMLTSFLRLNGFSVAHTDRPDAALALLDSVKTDLILVDKSLGRESGIELIRELRNQGHPAAIILMSGYFEPGDVELGLDAGADLVISKPIRDLRRLADFIGCCTERRVPREQSDLLCNCNDAHRSLVDSFETPFERSTDFLVSACSRMLHSPFHDCNGGCHDSTTVDLVSLVYPILDKFDGEADQAPAT